LTLVRNSTAQNSAHPSTGTCSTKASTVKIKPRTPRLNGKVERSHRIDSEEFYRLLEGQVIDDTRLFTDKLQEWEDYYNYHRPHGALAGQTPYERLRQKAQDPLS
jgi:transposase InsO family protein